MIVSQSENFDHELQIGISIPKKKISKAVNRNLLKRRINEIVRIKKFELYPVLKKSKTNLHIFIIFSSSKIVNSINLEKDIFLIFEKIKFEISIK